MQTIFVIASLLLSDSGLGLQDPRVPPGDDSQTQPTNAAQRSAYADALVALEDATIEFNTDPEHAGASLRAAIGTLEGFGPELAADPQGRRLRLLAELSLARAALGRDDRPAAEQLVDAALIAWGEAPLPDVRFGPSLEALVAERQVALAAAPASEPAATSADESAPVEPPPPTFQPTPTIDPATQLDRRRGPKGRLAPRGVEIGAAVAGGVAVIVGAVLWAIDSKCPGGVDPHDIAACPELYDTRTAGIVATSAGAAALLTGAVMLGVDEVAIGRRRGHQLGFRWRMQF